MAIPDGRFSIAFAAGEMLVWDADFTQIDNHPSLVVSYSIDRGRQIEMDRTDTGRATVEISDRDGILDPTNSSGPYYGLIEPMLQAVIRRRNPVTGSWQTRFRGFIEELDYSFDPSQQVNRLTISLVDLFEILQTVEMQNGSTADAPMFGDAPPSGSADQVFFNVENVDQRITRILMGCLLPDDYQVIFTGNVEVQKTVYSPGEAAMTAVQEAADAEFPGVSNVYVDRYGRLAFHGRLAKFDPVGTHASATPGSWDFHQWKAGDGTAVGVDPAGTAHIRRFAFNRGLSKIVNSAFATPKRDGNPLTAAQQAGQLIRDTTSIGLRGLRSWSAQELITKRSLVPGVPPDDLAETRRFAAYYVANYAEPRNRTTDIGFRSCHPTRSGAGANWGLLSQIDVSDLIQITIDSPGGGGFDSEPFFVEGIHETVEPLNPDYDDVTLTLDLSPQALFDDTSMFPEMA